MPFAHQVGGVPGLAQPLGQGVHVGGQAAGLAGPDDGVLEACVDLISARRRTTWVSPLLGHAAGAGAAGVPARDELAA